MNLFKRLFGEPYVHPLAIKRRDLADRLSGWSIERRGHILSEIAESDPALFESWILEPYPGRGDR